MNQAQKSQVQIFSVTKFCMSREKAWPCQFPGFARVGKGLPNAGYKGSRNLAISSMLAASEKRDVYGHDHLLVPINSVFCGVLDCQMFVCVNSHWEKIHVLYHMDSVIYWFIIVS